MEMIDLGWCMARFSTNTNVITIVSPADFSEGINAPAQTVTIYGAANLIRLRDALNKAYPQNENTPCINS